MKPTNQGCNAPQVLRAILDAKEALFRIEPDELRRLADVIGKPRGGDALAETLRHVATGVEQFRRRLANIEAGRDPLADDPTELIV
jgi:hypothetical protein